MIDIDAALRLLRNIVEELDEESVRDWVKRGMAHLSPELDLQDFATLLRLVSGEAIAEPSPPSAPPRRITDQILPNGTGVATPLPPNPVRDPFHWDVV